MKSLTSIMGFIAGLAGGIAIFLIQLQGAATLMAYCLSREATSRLKRPLHLGNFY